LTSEAYIGTLVWGQSSIRSLNPIRAENAWPAIIDKETFYQVQAMLKERAPSKANTHRVASRYLLSGIANYGHCGKALIGQKAKSGKFAYYICGILLKKDRAHVKLST